MRGHWAHHPFDREGEPVRGGARGRGRTPLPISNLSKSKIPKDFPASARVELGYSGPTQRCERSTSGYPSSASVAATDFKPGPLS